MNTFHPRPMSRDHLAKFFTVVIIALTLFAAPAMSQTNTFPTSGNVGIGTTNPTTKLDILSDLLSIKQRTASGGAYVYAQTFNGSGDFRYGVEGNGAGTLQVNSLPYASQLFTGNMTALQFGTNQNVAMTIVNGGSIGLGTTNPLSKFDIVSDLLSMKQRTLTPTSYVYAETLNGSGDFRYGLEGDGPGTLQVGSLAYASQLFTGNTTALQLGTNQNVAMTMLSGGNIGIGTNAPAAKLDVNGNVNVSGNIAAKYQDVAEWVPATEEMEPGTVVVLNPEKSNEVMPATRAYDTTVAGVVSTNPGLILGEGSASKAQIASAGRVRVKVTATQQPIHIGDLLVTSGKTGVAMKSEPMKIGGRAFHQPGTIIGKALEPLGSGDGEILVLLSLQ